MIHRDVAKQIADAGSAAGLSIDVDLAEQLAAYLALLARWNRKINLTALDVHTPTVDAIERLIVEPIAAAQFVGVEDRACVDIGSGGGSPAVPLKLARPALRMLLVESRARKAAFLNEVARQLSLNDVRVANARLEDLAASGEFANWADVATIRAVRVDQPLLESILSLLNVPGRILWFRSGGGSNSEDESLGAGIAARRHVLTVPSGAELVVLSRKTNGDD